jgi:hypothetical protein
VKNPTPSEPPFTKDDLWSIERWDYTYYFLEALNGEDSIENIRNNLRSLIGTKWDSRSASDESAETEA